MPVRPLRLSLTLTIEHENCKSPHSQPGELEVSDISRRDGLHRFESLEIGHPVEQTVSPTQQSRDQVQHHLVYHSGVQVLAGDIGSAGQGDVLSVGGATRLVIGRADPVGDKGERGAAFQLQRGTGGDESARTPDGGTAGCRPTSRSMGFWGPKIRDGRRTYCGP